MGIRLTQVGTTGSMRGDGGLPAESDRVGGEIHKGRGLPGVAGAASLAGGVPLPALRRGQVVAGTRDVTGVLRLWRSDVGDGGNHISGHADAFGRLVSGDVVGDYSEERRQCLGPAAGVGSEELRNGLDVAA